MPYRYGTFTGADANRNRRQILTALDPEWPLKYSDSGEAWDHYLTHYDATLMQMAAELGIPWEETM